MPAEILPRHLPAHPHNQAGLHPYADVMPRPGLIECSHRLAGGTQAYTNQYGSGYRCSDCATKWFRRTNGQEIQTSGPSSYRVGGWHPSMPVSGTSPTPPPLSAFLSIEQIAEYNDERLRNNLDVVAVDGVQWGPPETQPEAQDVDRNRQQPAGFQSNA